MQLSRFKLTTVQKMQTHTTNQRQKYKYVNAPSSSLYDVTQCKINK